MTKNSFWGKAMLPG